MDHFDGQYPEVNIIGTCNHCNKTDVLVCLSLSPPPLTLFLLPLSTSLSLSPPLLSHPILLFFFLLLQPRVTFQCHSCEEGNQAILRQIRDNVYDIPCMKCSLRQLAHYTHTHTLLTPYILILLFPPHSLNLFILCNFILLSCSFSVLSLFLFLSRSTYNPLSPSSTSGRL